MPTSLVLIPVLLAALAAQPDAGKADPKAPAAAPHAEPQPAAKPDQKAEKPTFPAAVKKELYASNDLRGKPAPKFEVEKWLAPVPKGTAASEAAPEVKAVDMKGKVILIDFWATWCPPCRAAIPELNHLQKTFKDDLVIIGVSDEKADKVQPFLDRTPVEYAMAVDTQARMKSAVGVKGIPNVLIIGTDNVVRWQGFPGLANDPMTEETIRQIIEADKARRAAEKPDATKPAAGEKKPEPAEKK